MFFRRKLKQEEKRNYSFVKSLDNGESYTLFNYKGKVVYRALKIQAEAIDNKYSYVFENCKDGKKYAHEISRRRTIDDNGSKKLTFTFDGADIWSLLSELGIKFRVTFINNNVTDFHILQDENDFAFARLERSADRSKKIKITRMSGSDNMLFFVFFVITRLY